MSESLEQFTDDLFVSDVIERASQLTGLNHDDMLAFLRLSVGESKLSARLLRKYDLGKKRILEVGAGSGILAAYLHRQGHDIVCIEPGGNDFDLNGALHKVITERYDLPTERRLRVAVEDLAVPAGSYDLIFSNNVLEHIPKLEAALTAMNRLLADGGVMVHHCPNYHVPFEPHFRIPLIPLFEKQTKYVMPWRINNPSLWNDLNFVTSTRIERAASRLGCDVEFEKGTLYVTLSRLVTDDEFRKRHPRLGAIAGRVEKLGLFSLTKKLPYWISTPMTFEWRKGRFSPA